VIGLHEGNILAELSLKSIKYLYTARLFRWEKDVQTVFYNISRTYSIPQSIIQLPSSRTRIVNTTIPDFFICEPFLLVADIIEHFLDDDTIIFMSNQCQMGDVC